MHRVDRWRAEAKTLRETAYQIERRIAAWEDERRRDEDIARRKRVIERWARAASTRTDEACINGLARELPCETGSARLILAEQWGRRGRAAEARRNREVMRLARLGWTNAEIGAEFGLTPKHISRLISEALARGRYTPQPSTEHTKEERS